MRRKVLNLLKNKFSNSTMEDPSLDKPDEIRTYLKENMAEGYLSESEEEHIDKFVDRYTELMENRGSGSAQEIVRRAYEVKTQ